MILFSDLTRGIVRENPIFRLVLGMCPTLAVTTTLENGIGMGLATTFVLFGSNIVISAVRRLIPASARIPCYVIIIASFVTTVDMLIQAYTTLADKLGIFIPLIVVNCIILGRAEAFASRNNVLHSAADGLGMGIGFTLALALIASIRELLGTGALTLWEEWKLILPIQANMLLFILPAGGFITLGCLLGWINHLQTRAAVRAGKAVPPPLRLDCRSCTLCTFGS
jgi:Na+-translocating ferredoxin:NAD+ oxidoreductase subunit E